MKLSDWDYTLKRKGAIGFAIVALFAIIVLFFSVIISGLVEDRLNKTLSKQDSLLYDVSFKSLHLNLLTGSVKVDSICVMPKESMVTDSTKGVFRGDIESIHVQKFGYVNYFFRNKVSLGKLKIKGAELVYLPNKSYVKSTKRGVRRKSVLGGKIKEIELGVVEFSSVQIKKYKNDTSLGVEWSMDDTWVSLRHIRMDDSIMHNELPFSFSELKLGGSNIVSNGSDFYNLRTQDFSFNSSTQNLSVSGFTLKPKYSRKQFSEKLKHENDMFDVSLKSIKINGLDVEELIANKHLQVSTVNIDSPIVSIYRDKRVKGAPYKHKPLVTTAIKKIPISTHVSSIMLEGGKLIYEEKQANNKPAGLIFFDLETIQIANVCNITSEIHKSPVMEMDLKAKIMGKGEMKAHFDFHLTCASDSFYLEGNLDETPASAFNPMTENLLNVKIESGMVNSAFFAFSGTDDVSLGRLDIDYCDLKVDVLKQDAKKNKLFSAAANGLVLDDNMKGSKKYRKGYVHYKRDKNKGFPNYLWKSIGSAIVPVVAPMAETKEHKSIRQKAETKAL